MNNNNQLNNKNHKDSFLKCTSGSIVISMAIMLPAIFICMAFSINQAYTMRNRAMISEATNEASLAVIAIDNRNVNDEAKKQNRTLALNYINYFISKEIGDASKTDANLLKPGSEINVDYDEDKHEYYIAYNQKFNEFIEIKDNEGEKPQPVVVGNKTESYGNTRKYLIYDSFDFAFISDFSASSTCQYSDVNCNDYSPNNNAQRRLDYMKDAIEDIIEKYKEYSQYQFALVPYDIGVPEENKTKNAAGGQNYNCSVMYKMKKPYDSIDYNFWSNKNVAFTYWSKLKKDNVIKDYSDKSNYFPNHRKLLTYFMDSSYYNYYAHIVGPALGLEYGSNKALVNAGLCSERTSYQDRVEYGLHQYACGIGRDDQPGNNRGIIEREYATVVQLFDYMFSGNYNDAHYSFANSKTVDIEGTISTLFSDMQKNIIRFERPISPVIAEFSPFMGMCQSPLYSNNLMNGKMVNVKKVTDEIYREIGEAKYVAKFESTPHLIPFSNDKNHNDNILKSLKKSNWKPGGGTDTMTALLRTVPIMAESNGNNKVMIIISDGKDDKGADVLRDTFLDKGVCQAITGGLRDKQNFDRGYIKNQAKSAIIYYIKLNPEASNLKTDSEYEAQFGKWFTKCMNGNPMFLMEARDKNSLTDVINKVIEIETGKFIKKNQTGS